MPLRQELVQPFFAKAVSNALAGSEAAGGTAPRRTTRGSVLFGTSPSSVEHEGVGAERSVVAVRLAVSFRLGHAGLPV